METSSETKMYNRKSIIIITTSICAALYAVGSYTTAYIPSPWGFGQFRPAVIIPALFAALFGPWPAGLGAAMGTLIADSVKHGYLYPGSFLAAVPGNFVGFFLLGYILKKKFSWARFIAASNLTLIIANAIVAFLYVFLFKVLYIGDLKYVNMAPEVLTFLSVGLTIYWFVTMLPFVLLVTPPLIRAVAAAFPSTMPEGVKAYSLREEIPKKTFALAMLIPGIVMLIIGLFSTTYADFGKLFSLAGAALTVTQILFYGSGFLLFVIGLFAYTRERFLRRKPLLEKDRESNK
jgi:uncharacterized membrane protein